MHTAVAELFDDLPVLLGHDESHALRGQGVSPIRRPTRP
jgi:hypothetical protein